MLGWNFHLFALASGLATLTNENVPPAIAGRTFVPRTSQRTNFLVESIMAIESFEG